MLPTRNLLDNLRASADHTNFLRALDAAGLTERLGTTAPHTVFAPSNRAFAALPLGLLEALLSPRSRAEAAAVTGLHILPVARTRAQIAAEGRASGIVRQPAVSGESPMLRMESGTLTLTDANGRRARVIVGDIAQANGVLHIIDTVLLPRM
jgi:uncharacterized surface protein with fasciclin (FAS1) repeats